MDDTMIKGYWCWWCWETWWRSWNWALTGNSGGANKNQDKEITEKQNHIKPNPVFATNMCFDFLCGLYNISHLRCTIYRQFYSTPPNILLGGISVGWPLWTWNGWDGSHLSPFQAPTNQSSRFFWHIITKMGKKHLEFLFKAVFKNFHPTRRCTVILNFHFRI